MLAVLAEMECGLILERTKVGLESARARGKSRERTKNDYRQVGN